MDTVEKTDLELIKHLDFEPACELRLIVKRVLEPVCENPVAWVCKCMSCGLTRLVCDSHRVVLLREKVVCTCKRWGYGREFLLFTPWPAS